MTSREERINSIVQAFLLEDDLLYSRELHTAELVGMAASIAWRVEQALKTMDEDE